MIDLKDVFLVRVVRQTIEAEDIVSLELESVGGEVLPRFEPGAHVDIHTPGGFVRQYSLCNSASETGRYMVAILRDPSSRGGSLAMHDSVKEGDVLQVSAPRNHFPLHPEAGHSLLFAGGIGVTPMLCMADELYRQGRPFTLNYCARSKSRMAFYEVISQSAWVGNVNFYFDDCVDERSFDI
jgi:vanillate O-demethylase ferredoxin subunit